MALKLNLDELKKLNEALNADLDPILSEWEEVENEKRKTLLNYIADINEAAKNGLSVEDFHDYCKDAEDLRDVSLAMYDTKEKELSDIAREDLANRVKMLKEQLKDTAKMKDTFSKEKIAEGIKADMKNIKEILNGDRAIYNKLHEVGNKIWEKAIAPIINAIKSPVAEIKKATVEKSSHLLATASRYAKNVTNAITKMPKKIGDFSKEAAKSVTDYVKYLDACCKNVDKKACELEAGYYEKKMAGYEDKLEALVANKLNVRDRIVEHEQRRAARKGLTLTGKLNVNTPNIDEKIAKVQKKILLCQEEIAKNKMEYYAISEVQESRVEGSSREGKFYSNEVAKAHENIKKQFADIRAQLDNASNFDIAMAGVINVNDKVMDTAFGERVEINGNEVPIYRVVIDSTKIKDNNILNPRIIAELSADERVYPTNQGYSYIYTTDPERAAEWGQEFSKRGVLHTKGIECSSEYASQLLKDVTEKNKDLGVTKKQKDNFDIEI